MRSGNLFVISGPSGAGKGTLVARLLREVDDTWLSISVTTRKPRGAEQNGKEYFFISEDEFKNLIENDGLLEWALVHGCYYGTRKESIEEQIDQGKQVILEIDVQGAFQIKKKMPHAQLIFIEPPSLETLKARLEGRGTDSTESIEKRMNVALTELQQKEKYDICVVNDNLNEATEVLVKYINTITG